ncbi:MAG: 4-hydroxy-tetrahydrodipicolinate synthase [Candidatus Eisenbacteria bacterium]|nr:4-hydroxy-tetrahydrodipicolinate synthase [Candidatus Eisenbacteria bacterium]
MFEGLSVAMVTPFREGRLDEEAVERLLEHILGGGAHGIVAAGCTGEAATLDLAEREILTRASVRRRGPGQFVLAGTGTNATRSTIDLTKRAEDWGVDGVLVITPYYNKPTQAGLIRHYEEVARSTSLPIVLYNVPGRTAVKLEPETIARLAEMPNIVAVKEACGSLDQVSELCQRDVMTVLSGDDSLTLPMLAVGARGIVSVAGNLFPGPLARMLEEFAEGHTEKARAIHLALFPLFRGLFLETNPGPIKRLLARARLIQEEFRLPLVPVSEKTAQALERIELGVEEALSELGFA